MPATIAAQTARPRFSSSDAALALQIRRAAAGDHAALNEIRIATFGKLFSVAMHLLHDRAACEDVLQEAYLSVWRHCGRYDPGLANPLTWMKVIVRRRAIDHLRMTRILRTSLTIEGAFEIPSPTHSPLDALETKDLLEMIFEQPGLERPLAVAALRMSLVDGVAYRVIAQRFNVPEGTMKGMIRQLLTNIRASLEDTSNRGRRQMSVGSAGRIQSVTARHTGVLKFMGQLSRISPATILVVESEAIVRLELADWLSGEGLIALSASDADEAITLLDAHPEIEIMMTDINMTGSMDGIRLAHHVRNRWPPVRIIVASGRPQASCVGLPSGAVFVAKPIERDRLLLTMGGLLAA